MNKKAELFQTYLDENTITCYQVQEYEDEFHTVAFRSAIEAEGQQLPTVLIFDDSIYTMIRVRIATGAMKEDKAADLSKAINELNAKYKVLKYYFAENGDLVLDSCIPQLPDQMDGAMVYTILSVMVNHILAEYKNLMKIIWA